MAFALFLAALPLAGALYQNGSVTAPCESPLYCQGEILRAVQLAAPFDDSKTFVDLYVVSRNDAERHTDKLTGRQLGHSTR